MSTATYAFTNKDYVTWLTEDHKKFDWCGAQNFNLSPAPNYRPVPGIAAINFFKKIASIYLENWGKNDKPLVMTKYILFPTFTIKEYAEMAEWISSTDNMFSAQVKVILNTAKGKTVDANWAARHSLFCMYDIAWDYAAYNRSHNRDIFVTLNQDWTFGTKPTFPWINVRDPRRWSEFDKLAAKFPTTDLYAYPGHELMNKVQKLLTNAEKRSPQYPEMFNKDVNSAQKDIVNQMDIAGIKDGIIKTFGDYAKKWEIIDVNVKNNDFYYYTWWGLFAQAWRTSLNPYTFSDWTLPNGKQFGKWPNRKYENEIFSIIASTSKCLNPLWIEVDKFVPGKKSPTGSTWTECAPDYRELSCPTEEQAKQLDIIATTYTGAISKELSIIKFKQKDIPSLLSLFSGNGGVLRDMVFKVGNVEYPSAIIVCASEAKYGLYSEEYQTALSIVIYVAYFYAKKIHDRIGGRPYSKWQWDATGGYVNPTDTEAFFDCNWKRARGIPGPDGKQLQCRAEDIGLWKTPWELEPNSEELYAYIEARLPLGAFRLRKSTEKPEDYIKKEGLVRASREKWRTIILANPKALKEHPIGDEWEVPAPTGKPSKLINSYMTMGMVIPEGLTEQMGFFETWISWLINLAKDFYDAWVQFINVTLDMVLEAFTKITNAAITQAKKGLEAMLEILDGALIPIVVIGGLAIAYNVSGNKS